MDKKSLWPMTLTIIGVFLIIGVVVMYYLKTKEKNSTANRYTNAIMYDPLSNHSNNDHLLTGYRNDSVSSGNSLLGL